jgi:CheY-like chemotaxis protein
MKVIIAHANDGASQIIRQFLSEGGCDVETVSDGLECLEQLRRLVPDVLVLDLELPWGGGDGVLARMREDGDTPSVPVVLMTRTDPDGDLIPLFEPPVAYCLRKPFRLDALLRAIHSAASRRRSRVARAPVALSRAGRWEPIW